MLLTRSIRRKLSLSLGLVFLLLLFFAISSVQSLRAYSRMIHNLETTVSKTPHQGELIAAFASLVAPLTVSIPYDPANPAAWNWTAQRQQDEFLERLGEARKSVDKFRKQLRDSGSLAAASTEKQRELEHLFQRIDSEFPQFESNATLLTEPTKHQESVRDILKWTSQLIDLSTEMPDPAVHLLSLLNNARADYESHRWLVVTLGVTSLIVAAAVSIMGYHWFFKPLRALHRDFQMVAKGDYSHRSSVDTNDELASLAKAFNSVTSQFQSEVANREQEISIQARKLVQSERVVNVGFLAAGVAHDLNNPLGIMAACGEAIERQFYVPLAEWAVADYEMCREYSQMISSNVQRCQRMTHRLLDFAHGTNSEKNYYDLTAIIRDVVQTAEHMGKYQDRKILFERAEPCEAYVSGDEIKQVALNLVANALQATPPGGRLTITLVESTDQVEILFEDTGCGMTPEILENLFDPFFTTKEVGQGTGLGLSLTRKMIESHGGTIGASSEGLGKGSKFRVRLPKMQATPIRV